MDKLIFPHSRSHERPTGPIRRVGPIRGRAWFVGAVLRLGGERFGWVLGLAGLAAGITASYLVTRLFDLPASWAFAIVFAVLFLISVEGGYRLWEREQKTAMRFRPTWEILQDRADTLGEVFDANYTRQEWSQFLQRNWFGSHREAARLDYDTAETAGYPLTIEREELRRPANPDEFQRIISAFEDAAARWKAMEREQP